MLSPGTAQTFQEYLDLVFLSYVSNQLYNNCQEGRHSVGCMHSRKLERLYQAKKRKKYLKTSGSKYSNPPKLKKKKKICVELFNFLSYQAICLLTDEGKVIHVSTTMANAFLKNLSPLLT